MIVLIVFQCIVMMEFINSQIIIHGNSIKTLKLAAATVKWFVRLIKRKNKSKNQKRSLFRYGSY